MDMYEIIDSWICIWPCEDKKLNMFHMHYIYWAVFWVLSAMHKGKLVPTSTYVILDGHGMRLAHQQAYINLNYIVGIFECFGSTKAKNIWVFF